MQEIPTYFKNWKRWSSHPCSRENQVAENIFPFSCQVENELKIFKPELAFDCWFAVKWSGIRKVCQGRKWFAMLFERSSSTCEAPFPSFLDAKFILGVWKNNTENILRKYSERANVVKENLQRWFLDEQRFSVISDSISIHIFQEGTSCRRVFINSDRNI